MHFIPRHPALFATGTVLTALVLAGCGSSDTSTAATGSSPTTAATAPTTSSSTAAAMHNEQDVSYATDMITHHRQAVEMADMALGRETTPQVKALAARIKAEQTPEISRLSSFLTTFGKPIPAAGAADHSMSGMSGDMAEGMMSADEMTALDAAKGPEFTKAWLTSMTGHHRGAVTMSRTELSSGDYTPAKQLATSIVKAQDAEIAEMAGLLKA